MSPAESPLRVIEVFASIQGEGTHAGMPCAFVRLAGCNLACEYCDTDYARTEPGTPRPIDELADEVHALGHALVCVTGGEPLVQPGTALLAARLIELGHTVVVETNGSLDTSHLPAGAIRILDVKCPASGECGQTHMPNLDALRECDEVKFVLSDRRDFDWAVEFVRRHGLTSRCTVLFSPVPGRLDAVDLATWILDAKAGVRLQLQLHKIIWPDRTRGV